MSEPGAPAPPLLAPGTRIGHYEVDGVIGHGGMGVVYRAVDTKLSRRVAIKCIRPDRATEVDYRKRQVREARVASRLSHPNIVRVLDVLERDGLPVIVMELVEGPSLRSRLEETGGLPVEEILSRGLDLARALASAHASGILHRDVNPNNVLLAPDGRAVLTDFGLARRAAGAAASGDSGLQSTGSAPGTVVGTPGYMAPEQILGRTLDARADIFSLGAVLYEMCTGARAFPVSNVSEVIDATLNREALPFGQHRHGLPEELERIVRKAMAKRPDERYQDARELETDLRALGRRLSIQTAQLAAPASLVRGARRSRVAAGAAAVALPLLAWLGLWLWRRPEPLPEATPRNLTSGKGFKTEPSISPDGSFVAYASDETGDFEIWVADAVSGQTLRLTTDPAQDRSPAFFPDGSSIAFASTRGGGRSVWRTTRLGGPPSLLVPDASYPAISPDGTRIAFARAAGGGGYLRIWVAPLADLSQARCVSSREGFWDHLAPVWSPDGRTICYEDFDGLWLVPAAGGTPRRLTTGETFLQGAAWSADGRSLYLSASQGETRALFRAPSGGGAARRLTLGTAAENHASVSRDGRRLAYSTTVIERRLLLAERKTGALTEVPALNDAYFPVLSRDATRLAFIASAGDRYDVFGVPLRGGRPVGEPRRMTNLGSIGTFAVSPDGRFVAVHTHEGGRRDIVVVPEGGGDPVRLVDHPGADVDPAFSPDGKVLAFSSDRAGNPDVWLLPLAGPHATGPPRRLTQGPVKASFPEFSPAGERIAFVGDGARGTEVWVVAVDRSSPPAQVTTGAQARRALWGTSPDVLLVAGTWGTAEIELREVRLPGGESTPLSPPVILGDQAGLGLFSVSGDGALLAYLEERSRGDVWLLEAVKGRF